jgi:hypothetical protein
MRALLLGAVFAFASASVAFAGDDIMANFYGNTVITKTATGESHTHYKKDGTVDADLSGPMGSISLAGTWKIDDKGQLCRTYANVPAMLPIPNPLCTPWAAHNVGDSWTITMNGQVRTVTLVKGIQ